MGEVYRATDTNLKRAVAIKVLPALLSGDPDRLARFQREAEVLAALNHPNIASIYGLERANGITALVMELVEGQTLADLIARGAIPVDEALGIAKQIAEALEAAHERGIIHRDLKPSNVKVRPDGTVKVLDFGLAKLTDPAVASSSDSAAAFSMSPTITTPAMMTGVGLLLGTAAYMAPEQAKGKPADKRSDVWAFGCVLFEMLTGRRAFEGTDTADVIAAVLRSEPDWAALPPNLSPPIRALLRRCLEKDRRNRVPDVSIARFTIEDPSALSSAGSGTAAVHGSSTRSAWLPWIAAAVLALLLAATVVRWAPWTTPPVPSPVRVTMVTGADVILNAIAPMSVVAISPDGSTVAFTATTTPSSPALLYVRRLDQLHATPLAGTEGAGNPVFSPDGQSVAFFAQGKLKKIAVTGGAAVTLCDAPAPRGASWGDDGSIVFQPVSQPGPLQRVSSDGGAPQTLAATEAANVLVRWPQVLPGGRGVIYSRLATSGGGWENGDIVLVPLPEGMPKVLQHGAHFGRYVKSGHLVYVHQGTLFAAPFDLNTLALAGPGVPVIEGVASSGDSTGAAQFAFSDNGSVVYLTGESRTTSAPIVWMGSNGKTTPLRADKSDWSNPAFSPDGQRLAVDIFDGSQTDVWTYDWARDTLSRLTFDPTDDSRPAWSPDGKRIVFASKRADKKTTNLYWQRADGTGDVQRLTTSDAAQFPGSWHPSGKFFAFDESRGANGEDLMILPMEGDEATGWKPGKPTVFLSTPFQEASPMFSPDGRWIAYISNESGLNQIYVRPFPGPGGKWQVSNAAADDPTWSRTKKELFFAAPNETRILVAPYTVDGDSFRVDKPRAWSDGQFYARPRPPSRDFDLHPDGQRFAMAASDRPTGAGQQDKVVLVLNAFGELRRVAPAAKH